MNKREKIYYFAYSSLNTASVRYRGVFLLKTLRKNLGINYTIVTPEKKKNVLILPILFLEIFIINPIWNIKSTFICQKISHKSYYYNILYLLFFIFKKKYYYDIDDAMYLIKDKKVVDKFIIHAEKIFVASTELQNYCKSLNSETYLLTTPVPISKHKKTQRNALFNMGWIGYFSHYKKDLYEILFPSIKNINSPILLTLLGVTDKNDVAEIEDYFSDKNNIKIYTPLNIDWKDEDYISTEISKFDVGLAPSSNTEINRAKSAFKIKQYLSCSVPVIASDVGDNRLFVADGINGFLCRQGSDFEKYINIYLQMNNEEFNKTINNCNIKSSEYSLDKFSNDLVALIK
jgi:glycosyltransferase involved in cell wall biosynthesis